MDANAESVVTTKRLEIMDYLYNKAKEKYTDADFEYN